MGPIITILTACANALLMSSVSAYEREIVDGGTQNRSWTFLIQLTALPISFGPLWLVFPIEGVLVSLLYYASIGVIGVLSYVASICHSNQIKRNFGQEEVHEPIQWRRLKWDLEGIIQLGKRLFATHDKIEPLPWNLHNNKFFTKTMYFLNQNFIYGMGALYFSGLILVSIYVSPLYCIASLSMFAIDRVYQQGWFPNFLETIYFMSRNYLILGFYMGFDSTFSMVMTAVNVAYSLYDYVQTHMRQSSSPSSQFPMATPANTLSLKEVLGSECKDSNELSSALMSFKSRSRTTRVTYNHFHESHILTEKIFANAPVVNFGGYKKHFNGLDFKSETLREQLLNEMTIHDKFHSEPLETRQRDLKLPADSTLVEVEIAFLKKEIEYLVERLSNPSYRDFNNQQVNSLQGQARHLLNYLNIAPESEAKNAIIISLAIRTGSHCNRMYLEVFSELAQYVYPSLSLSLKDQVILDVQAVREDAFRTYYYKLCEILQYKKIFDVNDYHTYENFVAVYGSFFYLRNSSLSQRVRDIGDVIDEKIFSHLLADRKISFSDFYSEKFLINEVLNGKLHQVFMAWCAEIYPDCYREMIVDEYSFVKSNDLDVQALAKLMLIDCGIIELTEPFVAPAAVVALSLPPSDSSFGSVLKTAAEDLPRQEEPEVASGSQYFSI